MRYTRRVIGGFIASVMVCAMASLCGCNSGYHVYSVANDSMSPLIRSGDHILADQTEEARTDIHDGDVILFRHNDTILIKRVIAMPGEIISGEHWKVFRNNQLLSESYIATRTDEEIPELATFRQRTIPTHQLFVVGDNRNRSLDSRADEYGPVTFDDVVGKYKMTIIHSSKTTEK